MKTCLLLSICAFFSSGYAWVDPTTIITEAVVGTCSDTLDGMQVSNVTTLNQSWKSISTVLTTNQISYLKSLRPDPSMEARGGPVTRKEVRSMSKEEMSRFQKAFRKLTSTYIDGRTQHEIFILIHQEDISLPSTRGGPSQYGWHREYLVRFEEALRQHDSSVALPYWNIAYDSELPSENETVLWTADLMGNCDYDGTDVNVGAFAYVKNTKECKETFRRTYWYRQCGFARNGTLSLPFTKREKMVVMNYTSFTELDKHVGDCFIQDHDIMHEWLGGVTNSKTLPMCAVSDVVSWVLHAYIDYLWEIFRTTKQKTDLETDYPPAGERASKNHRAEDIMYPWDDWNLRNIDGYSKNYSRYWAVYENEIFTCETSSDCGSNGYLWCWTEKSLCKSKIKAGGNCFGLEKTDACYEGTCDTTSYTCVSSK